MCGACKLPIKCGIFVPSLLVIFGGQGKVRIRVFRRRHGSYSVRIRRGGYARAAVGEERGWCVGLG